MAVRQEAPHLSHDNVVHDALDKAGRAIRKHPIKAVLAVGATAAAVAAVGIAPLREGAPPASANEVSQTQSGTVLPPADLPSVGVLSDQRPTGGVGGGEGGLPGVLPDQPSQPSTEGPPEGGEGGGEGGNGEPPQPDGSQTAGGGVPPEDRPAVVQPVPEFVRQYEERRPDGSVWLVDEFKVGNKLAWTAKQVNPPTVSPPPPPAVSTSQVIERTSDLPARKKFPEDSVSGGEGIVPRPNLQPPRILYQGFFKGWTVGERGFEITIAGQKLLFFIMDSQTARSSRRQDVTLVFVHDTSSRKASEVPFDETLFELDDAISVYVLDEFQEENNRNNGPRVFGLYLYR